MIYVYIALIVILQGIATYLALKGIEL